MDYPLGHRWFNLVEYKGKHFEIVSGLGGCKRCYHIDKGSSKLFNRLRDAEFCQNYCKIDHLRSHWRLVE